MKITGSTKVDLSLTNFDYEIGIMSGNTDGNIINLGLSHAYEKKKTKNCANLESKLGPLNLKLILLSDDNKIPDNIENIDLNLSAVLEVDKNFNMGIKYETNGSKTEYEVLSGLINSKVNYNNFGLNLETENIIYGYKYKDGMKINLFGNKIKPSICLIDDKLNLGLIHNQREEIDEYGNKKNETKNNLCLDLDLKF